MRDQSPESCASWRMPSRVATAPSTPATAGSRAVRPASSIATLSRARVRGAADDVDRAGCRSPSLVGDHERPDRFPELAQAGHVGVRDPVARRHEPLLPEPRLGLLRGSDAIPLGREVVVVGVDEALEQLEPPGRLRPPSGLDLLADPSLVALLHGLRSDQHKPYAGQALRAEAKAPRAGFEPAAYSLGVKKVVRNRGNVRAPEGPVLALRGRVEAPVLGVADPSAFGLVCAFCARVETFSGLRRSRIEAMNPGRRSSRADGLVATVSQPRRSSARIS